MASIDLSDANYDKLCKQATAAGYSDVSDYLVDLVSKDNRANRKVETIEENALEAFERLGLVGCLQDAPKDLATNPMHKEGFGKDGQSSD